MKVLFWLSIGLDQRTPSEHLLTGIVEALYHQGHSVHILQKDTKGPLPHLYPTLIELGVTTTLVPCKPTRKSNLVDRYLKDIYYVFRCIKHLINYRDFGAVFVQSSNVAGIEVILLRKKLPGIPITFNVQDIFPENAMYSGTLSRNSLVYRLLTKIQQYAYRHANHLITISEDMKDTLVELGAPLERIEVIYNWSYQDEPYDKDKMDRSAVAHIFNPEYFNVVYAGNIGRMQNVDLLIKAAERMKEYKDIWFHIIGEGVHKDKLITDAKEMGIWNISFWPMMSPDLAPAIYCSADVNVIPLAENIYRTAMPSKTATCLAIQQPIILCIGKKSHFSKMYHQLTNCPILEHNDTEGLVQAILLLKANRIYCTTGIMFERLFRKTVNSKQYAEIITKVHVKVGTE